MEFISGYNTMNKYKVLSEKETGLGGSWYLVECGENLFAYGTSADIQGLSFVPVNQYGTREELNKRCELIINLKQKNINKYEKEIIEDNENPKGWSVLINLEKKELEALTDFVEKLK